MSAYPIDYDIDMLIADLKEFSGETLADMCSDALKQQRTEIERLSKLLLLLLLCKCCDRDGM